MKKRILIVNQNAGYLTIDVANAFAAQYDEVVVMYGFNRVTERIFHPKIKIQKTIVYNRSSVLKRLWTWGACTLHLFFLLLWKYKGFSILYYTNPPMSYFSSLILRNPFGIVVFDTYPNALTLIGTKQNSFIYKLWAKINRKVFKDAQIIITLSEGMKCQLLEYVAEEKIHVVSIWPASDSFKPINKGDNLFLIQHGWEDKFIILYSGNMGIGHKLEVLIDVAGDVQTEKNILFLFVGEGAKKKSLQNKALEKQLKNVVFMTWQDSDMLPYSLASGDIAVVALEPGATHASVPSKTFNYMAVGAPILGIGSEGSDLETLIQEFNIGYYVDGENTNEIRKFIMDMYVNTAKSKVISLRTYNLSKEYSYYRSSEYVF